MALYMHHGDFATKLSNFLLFLGYWIAPLVGIVLVDWFLRRGRADSWSVVRLRTLPIGWQALAALAAGFAGSLPFMDSSLYVGAVASGPLQGGDIAYIVGGILAGLVYWILAKLTRSVSPAAKAGAGLTSEIPSWYTDGKPTAIQAPTPALVAEDVVPDPDLVAASDSSKD
jgi:purine-cytosine permease-like protein